jgi:hypothetical protein
MRSCSLGCGGVVSYAGGSSDVWLLCVQYVRSPGVQFSTENGNQLIVMMENWH